MTVVANVGIPQSRYTNKMARYSTVTFAYGKINLQDGGRAYPCVTMSSAKVLKAYQQEPVIGRINFGSPQSTASYKPTVERNAAFINN